MKVGTVVTLRTNSTLVEAAGDDLASSLDWLAWMGKVAKLVRATWVKSANLI